MIEFDHHLDFLENGVLMQIFVVLQLQLHSLDCIGMLLEFVSGLKDDSLSSLPDLLHIHKAVLELPVFEEELERLLFLETFLRTNVLSDLELETLFELHGELLHKVVAIVPVSLMKGRRVLSNLGFEEGWFFVLCRGRAGIGVVLGESGKGELSAVALGVGGELRETFVVGLELGDVVDLAEEEDFLPDVLEELFVLERLLLETAAGQP